VAVIEPTAYQDLPLCSAKRVWRPHCGPLRLTLESYATSFILSAVNPGLYQHFWDIFVRRCVYTGPGGGIDHPITLSRPQSLLLSTLLSAEVKRDPSLLQLQFCKPGKEGSAGIASVSYAVTSYISLADANSNRHRLHKQLF